MPFVYCISLYKVHVHGQVKKGKNKSIYVGIKERIVELRKSTGMKQREFAEWLGVSKSAISMYELGDRKPSHEFYEKMAEKHFNINWLLTGEGKPCMDAYVDKRDAMLATKKTPKLEKQK